MTSIIQIAEHNYRTVDSNTLTVVNGLGIINEYVPPTNPDEVNYKSGRKSAIINLNSLKSIEVDAKSSITVNSVNSLTEALSSISEE